MFKRLKEGNSCFSLCDCFVFWLFAFHFKVYLFLFYVLGVMPRYLCTMCMYCIWRPERMLVLLDLEL